MLCLRRRDFFDILRKEAPLAVKLLWSFTQVLTERLRKTTAELSVSRTEQSAPGDGDGIDEVVNFE